MNTKSSIRENGDEGGAALPAATPPAVTSLEEEPTAAAYVKITTTSDGPIFLASVPEKEAGRMLETVEMISGIGGTVIGPFMMAKTLELGDAGMPWQIRTVLLALAALLPMVCYWLRRLGRRD